jgi:hypothetical protein
MSDNNKFSDPAAERMRIQYLYRSAVLRGRVKLPPEALKSLVGPDCAYHLYKYSGKRKDNQ